MKTTKLIVLLLAFITLSLTSCKKDDPEPTKTEIIVDGDWNLIKGEYYENGTLEETDTPSYTIKLNFKSDHTGVTTTGDGEINAWTWSFNSDETQITLSYNGDIETYHIDKLNNSELWFSDSYTEDGINYKDLYIFNR